METHGEGVQGMVEAETGSIRKERPRTAGNSRSEERGMEQTPSELLGGATPANAMVLEFWLPGLRKKTLPLLKPHLWCFVWAALGVQHALLQRQQTGLVQVRGLGSCGSCSFPKDREFGIYPQPRSKGLCGGSLQSSICCSSSSNRDFTFRGEGPGKAGRLQPVPSCSLLCLSLSVLLSVSDLPQGAKLWACHCSLCLAFLATPNWQANPGWHGSWVHPTHLSKPPHSPMFCQR